MLQLLLTRTPEQNKALTAQLKRPDLSVFSVTLLQAEAVALSHAARTTILDLDQFDEIIFISKNAVSLGLPRLEEYWPQWPVNLKWFAVGKATASEMMAFGLSPVFPELASSDGLLGLPDMQQVEGHRILIVRGIGGRETLKQGLTNRGAKTEYLEVYDRKVLPHEQSELPDGDQVLALLYSGEAIERLQELVGNRISAYSLIVPSKRLEELAIDRGFDKVEVATNQEDQAMLKVLNQVLESLT